MKCDDLIEALRDELQEYGELICLFNDQQKAALERKVKLVATLQQAVLSQLEITQLRRRRRKRATHSLTTTVGQRVGISLSALIGFCDPVVQPLLEALTHEVNRLATGIKSHQIRNEMLFSRLIELPTGLAAVEA